MKLEVKKLAMVFAVLLAVMLSVAVSAEETRKEDIAGVEPEKHWHEIDAEWLNTFHNPAPGITMGLGPITVFATRLFQI